MASPHHELTHAKPAPNHDLSSAYVAENIKIYRLFTGLSLAAMGGYLGLSSTKILNMETGKTEVMAADLLNYSQFFGVPVDHFFRHPLSAYYFMAEQANQNDDRSTHFIAHHQADHEVMCLIEQFKKIKNHQQRHNFLNLIISYGKSQR